MCESKSRVETVSSTAIIGPYTYSEYLEQVRRFHGHTAPGVVVGGFMVDLRIRTSLRGNSSTPCARPRPVCPMRSNC